MTKPSVKYVSNSEWAEIQLAFSWQPPDDALLCPQNDIVDFQWSWVTLKTADDLADAMCHVRNFPLRTIAASGGADYFVGLYGNHDQPKILAALIDREIRHLTFHAPHDDPKVITYLMKNALREQRSFLEANMDHFYSRSASRH